MLKLGLNLGFGGIKASVNGGLNFGPAKNEILNFSLSRVEIQAYKRLCCLVAVEVVKMLYNDKSF